MVECLINLLGFGTRSRWLEGMADTQLDHTQGIVGLREVVGGLDSSTLTGQQVEVVLGSRS